MAINFKTVYKMLMKLDTEKSSGYTEKSGGVQITEAPSKKDKFHISLLSSSRCTFRKFPVGIEECRSKYSILKGITNIFIN